jgi:flagellar hook-associated protein 3 FlgL
MRVTDKSVFDAAARSTGAQRERLQKAVDENTTGLRVEHPWDDPGVTAPLIGHRLAASRQEAMAKTSERATDELAALDSSLGALTDTLTRARELAIQMSNDSYSATDRTITSEEVKTLFHEAIGLLNTRVGNRYLFSGFKDDQPAFDANGVYQGDSGVRQLEAFPGIFQNVSLPGDDIATGTGGGPNVLSTLQDLDTALRGNDIAGIQGTLSRLDDGIEHLSLSRAQMGAAANTLSVAVSNARTNVDHEKSDIAKISEADVFESATKLALAQRGLEAALTASARSFDLTLLNKL